MRGKNNSVMTRLKKKIPNLFEIHCLSHSVNLAASKASKAIPQEVELLISKVNSWFSYSPKEEGKFRELQDAMGLQDLQVLKMAGTRWLSF